MSTGITIYGCGRYEEALFRQLAPRYGVVPTMTESPVSEATAALAVGTSCVSVDHRTRVTGTTLRALGRAGVRHLSTRSVGHVHIDVAGAERVGISVATVAYSPDSVADYTLLLILMVLRGARSIVRRVEGHDYRLNDAPGRELRDLTVGVVGTGRIGAAVVSRLAGFGCRVLTHDARPELTAAGVPLDELLRASDVVTLHTPLTPATRHLLDRERIERMRAGAIVVNTGRGALVDTGALVAALESGRLGGAALDVVEGEEGIFHVGRRAAPAGREPFARLHRLPGVIISPHTAYFTDHALRDIAERTLADCRELCDRSPAWVA